MAIYCFRSMTYCLYKMRKPRMTKLGQGVEFRAHYPIYFCIYTRSVSYNGLALSLRCSGWCTSWIFNNHFADFSPSKSLSGKEYPPISFSRIFTIHSSIHILFHENCIQYWSNSGTEMFGLVCVVNFSTIIFRNFFAILEG